MNKSILSFTFSFMSLLLLSCSTSIELAKVSVCDNEGKYNAGQLFCSTKMIPLSDSITFGAIGKILEYNSRFYIMDNEGQRIYVYNSKGKNIGKISNRGHSGKEYLSLTDFDIDKSGNLYLYDSDSRKILLYDKNLHYKKNIPVCFGNRLLCTDDGRIVIHTFMMENFNVGVYNKDGKCLQKVPYPDGFESFPTVPDGNYLSYSDGKFYFSNPLDYAIYTVDEDGNILKVFNLEMGKWSYPEEFKHEKNPRIFLSHYTSSTDKSRGFRTFQITDDYIFITTLENKIIINPRSEDKGYYMDNMGLPYEIMLSNPIYFDLRGNFITYVANSNVRFLYKKYAAEIDKYPALKNATGCNGMSNDVIWILKGNLLHIGERKK